jgi:hypothetical protein
MNRALLLSVWVSRFNQRMLPSVIYLWLSLREEAVGKEYIWAWVYWQFQRRQHGNVLRFAKPSPGNSRPRVPTELLTFLGTEVGSYDCCAQGSYSSIMPCQLPIAMHRHTARLERRRNSYGRRQSFWFSSALHDV